MVSHLLAATANDAYNALVCTKFAPDLGRHNVFQLPHLEKHELDKKALARTIRGRIAIGEKARYEDLMRLHYQGWVFRKTVLSQSYDYGNFLKDKNEETILIAVVDKHGEIKLFPIDESTKPQNGDTLISYGPAKR